jgi:N-methylhydantoinase A
MPVPDARFRAGVDIGGTFTDLTLVDDETGRLWVGKVLTTPSDPSIAVHEGLTHLLRQTGVDAEQIRSIVHGTTLVTNAIIQRRGAKTALLTTRGFRDAIEIGKESRYDVYDIFLELPRPLVPRRLRREVSERVLDDGSVLEPLDSRLLEEDVRALQRQGVEAVAVCLLHSFKNPSHERAVAEVVLRLAPEICVSISSDVAPAIREYERASTTIANVYVRPLVDSYLHKLESRLGEIGFSGRLLIMLSSGAVCTVDTARSFPVRLVESGPAAGALAAAYYGELIGLRNLLSFDMGGTTAKACLIDDGRPMTSPDFEVARVYRFKRGSGFPLKTTVIELIEIGAGGGSISRIDSLGLLKVGPESAGASPGPACYGSGGAEPTVTDADLLLGYLDPDFFLGGDMKLDRDAALAAVAERVAKPIGVDVIQAAWGIHQVVNENMANASRIHAIERGKNPKAYPLFAFGGAGPVHAYRVAEILGLDTVIVPPGAGAASALGFLVAPLAFDFVRSSYYRLDGIDWEAVNRLYEEMESEGGRLLVSSGASREDVSVARSADMRYVGQGYEISVPVPADRLSPADLPKLLARFEEVYRSLYDRLCQDVPIEILNWRVVVSGPHPTLRVDWGAGEGGDAQAALKGHRGVYLPELGGFAPCPVYDRYRLGRGAELAGPAIVEERESTVVVGTRGRVSVDRHLNLVVRIDHGA